MDAAYTAEAARPIQQSPAKIRYGVLHNEKTSTAVAEAPFTGWIRNQGPLLLTRRSINVLMKTNQASRAVVMLNPSVTQGQGCTAYRSVIIVSGPLFTPSGSE